MLYRKEVINFSVPAQRHGRTAKFSPCPQDFHKRKVCVFVLKYLDFTIPWPMEYRLLPRIKNDFTALAGLLQFPCLLHLTHWKLMRYELIKLISRFPDNLHKLRIIAQIVVPVTS